MSYTKQVFNKNQVLTSDDMNILAEGVASKQDAFIAKDGLLIAVYGDSISTKADLNAVEIEITSEDVGVELAAYPSHHDVGKTIAGTVITTSHIGSELKFIPTASDIGKTLGGANNYNSASTTVWWEHIQNDLKCEVIPVTYSSSSYCSHEASSNNLKTAHAWHDSQIRKAGKRIPGSMQRISPDVIILYRGTNDMTHSPYAKLTSGYFDVYNWTYPTTDVITGGYGLKEAISLTIKKLRKAYPKAHICIATMNTYKRISYSTFPTHNGIYSLPQFNKALREVADFFGCQVIDFDKDGCTYENCYDAGYITDSAEIPTHPNSKGHALMGKQAVSDLINKLHIYDIEHSGDIVNSIGYIALNTVYSNKGVNAQTGEIYDISGYFTLDMVPVDSNSTYSMQYARNTALLDSEGNIIQVISGSTMESNGYTLTTTSDTAYLRTCARYDQTSVDTFIISKITVDEDEDINIVSSITPTNNKGVNAQTGEIYDISGYYLYDMVPVDSNSTYSMQYARNTALLNSSGAIIQVITGPTMESNGYTLTTTSDTAYLRTCVNSTTISSENFAIYKTTSAAIDNYAKLGTLMDGYAVSTTSTTPYAASGYFAYKDIPLESNTIYYSQYSRNASFADSSKSYTHGHNLINNTIVPGYFRTRDSDRYITVCGKTVDIAASEFSIINPTNDRGYVILENTICMSGSVYSPSESETSFYNLYFTVLYPISGGTGYTSTNHKNYVFYNSTTNTVYNYGGSGDATMTADTNADMLAVCYRYDTTSTDAVVIN